MIELYFWPTPNGKKVTILLEELGVPYTVAPCNIGNGDQFKEGFLKISPNNRMPALVDHAPADGGPPIHLFESGAIMMYLAEKHGRFYPQDLRPRYEVNQWVIWQMANQGPKLGECSHFRRLDDTKGDQSYAVRRFTDEANRLYGVLNNRLYDRRYLAGDEYTIADMISYPWTVNWQGAGAGHFRVPLFQALVRRNERAARGAARPRGHDGAGRGPGEPVAGGEGTARESALQSAREAGARRGRVAMMSGASPPRWFCFEETPS